MTVQEVAKQVMRDRGYSQGEVAKRAGMKGQSSVGMLLQGKSMRVDNLIKIMEACGYDLIVKDREGSGNTYRISEQEGIDIVSGASSTQGNDVFRDMVREIVREEMTHPPVAGE